MDVEMNIQILMFGIAKEIVGGSILSLDLPVNSTVSDLKSVIGKLYPRFGDLQSFMVAINSEYAVDMAVIEAKDEVAIIPPVSGG